MGYFFEMQVLTELNMRHSDWNKTGIVQSILRLGLTYIQIFGLLYVSSFAQGLKNQMVAAMLESYFANFLIGFLIFGNSRLIYSTLNLHNQQSLGCEFDEIKDLSV